MCKLFEIDGQKDFKKPAIFWKFSKTFIIRTCTRKLVSILFSFIFLSGNFVLFSMSYNEKNLSLKLLKSLCQEILLCKS